VAAAVASPISTRPLVAQADVGDLSSDEAKAQLAAAIQSLIVDRAPEQL
jgi:hypothetical protein